MAAHTLVIIHNDKKPTAVFTLLNRLLAAKKTSLSPVSLLTFCYHMLTDTHR